MSIARSGFTTDPDLAAISLARQINATLGGPFIAPWEINELPDTFIDTILAMGADLSEMKTELVKIEKRFAEWRANHPTYRK